MDGVEMDVGMDGVEMDGAGTDDGMTGARTAAGATDPHPARRSHRQSDGGGQREGAQGEGGEGDAREGALHSPHRLFSLVDGVFAIAMTLLALDVRVPDNVKETATQFDGAAPALYGDLGVFLVAFLITGRFWLTHHRLMSKVHTVDNEVLQRTTTFLAGISSIPVVTAVLFRFGSVPQAVTFASVVLAATSLLEARLWWYVSDPARGLCAHDPDARTPEMQHLLWNAGVYLLAGPVAYLLYAIGHGNHSHVSWATAVWLLLAADRRFARLMTRLRERRAR